MEVVRKMLRSMRWFDWLVLGVVAVFVMAWTVDVSAQPLETFEFSQCAGTATAGSCSGGGHTTQSACEGASETWTAASCSGGSYLEMLTGQFDANQTLLITAGIGFLVLAVIARAFASTRKS